jgi:catechol 2,3-dioxygenase-like lactoylglutathione lyase family enzyme
MVKKRQGDPWMPAPQYGAGLQGLSVNLLVSDIAASVDFAVTVLGATAVYADPDFAVLRLGPAEWMLHADHTYGDHSLRGFVQGREGRGAGIELRLHHMDPDAAEARAREAGHTVLAGSLDKPHRLREAYFLDPDGYCWVVDRPLTTG